MPKTSISDLQKVQIFPGSVSPDPLMCMSYTPKSNSTPIKCKKAYQIECFFGEKNNKLHLGNVSCTIDKALKVSPAVFLFKNRLLMESHLIQTMSVHCLQPFKTSIWFMFSYSCFIFSKFFSLSLSSFFPFPSSFFFWKGRGEVISINLGDTEGPLKKFLRKRGVIIYYKSY